MSKAATADTGLTLEAVTAALSEAVKAAVKEVQPKSVQMMSAAAFEKVDFPRPPIPTFQNGLPVDLRGVAPDALAKTMRQLAEIPSGLYLDGVVKVTRLDPAHNTEGRLDIRYDHSTTEKRMVYYSRVRNFSDLVDQMWREAHKG